jgi:acyl dehydratase
MVRDFASLSGDHNPVHLDNEFAKTTRFQQRIAHGMLSACFISRLLATELPGPGALYLGQTLRFTAPVYIDEEITIQAEVTAVREGKGILTIATSVFKEDGTQAVSGEATVMAQA